MSPNQTLTTRGKPNKSLAPHEGSLLEKLSKGKKRRVARMAKVAGRPTSLDVTTATLIIESVIEGNNLTIAAQAAGVTRRTLMAWKARGKKWLEDEEIESIDEVPPEDLIYVEFVQILQVALARTEAALLKRVLNGGRGWQAVMRVMESRWPERWTRTETHRHEGDPSRPISIEITPNLERAQEAARVLQGAGALEGTARDISNGDKPQIEAES